MVRTQTSYGIQAIRLVLTAYIKIIERKIEKQQHPKTPSPEKDHIVVSSLERQLK